VAQQRYAAAAFSGFNRARFVISIEIVNYFIILSFYRSPTRTDSINSNSINNRLRRTLASRSMSAEVFRSSIDTVNSGS